MISITIHEFAHAFAAVRAGDDTPRLQGRISLNPIDHFEPIGFTMMCLTVITGFGIGWGKPVQVNRYNFRHPRWDDLKVSAWGPGSNLVLAALASLVLHFGGRMMSAGIVDLLITLVLVNVTLALFNLIPLPPLDGSHILSNLLPIDKAQAYSRFAGQYGMPILLILLITGGLRYVIGPPSTLLLSFLL